MADYDINASVMGWDDGIEKDDAYITLPENDFNFTVTGFERGTFPGSDKMAPGPQAILELTVKYNGVDVKVKESLILNRVLEWKISGFFRSIGQKKHGERLAPKWNEVLGSVGRAHFKPRQGTGNSSDKVFNAVDKYIDFDPKFFSEQDNWIRDAKQASDLEEF